MAAALEQQPQPYIRRYRSKKYWEKFDAEMSEKFPLGEIAKVSWGSKIAEVKILTSCARGKIEVLNLVTGKQYFASAERMIPPTTKNPARMAEALAPERARLDQGRAQARTRPDIVRQYLRPIQDADRRVGELTFRDRAKLLPLSSDELVSYSALQAISKTLATLHSNSDSFRNPELFSLIDSARILLQTCVKEMEGYTELPEES